MVAHLKVLCDTEKYSVSTMGGNRISEVLRQSMLWQTKSCFFPSSVSNRDVEMACYISEESDPYSFMYISLRPRWCCLGVVIVVSAASNEGERPGQTATNRTLLIIRTNLSLFCYTETPPFSFSERIYLPLHSLLTVLDKLVC